MSKGPAAPPPPAGSTPAGTRRRLFVSLALRISVPVALLVITVAALVYVGLARQSRANLLGSKRAAAEMVVRLTSASVMPAVVFGDPEEMQRAVNDLARNVDVTDVELWPVTEGADPAPTEPLASFHRNKKLTLGRPKSPDRRSWFERDSVRLVEPVIDIQGKVVAAMSVRFTTAPEVAATARLSRQILLGSALVALSLTVAIVFTMLSVVVRPVKRLQVAAQRLANGEHTSVEGDNRSRRLEDEVGELADRFADMAAAVRDRENRLQLRSAELKLILDSVDQGFLTVLPDGKVLPERSAVVERWTGKLPAELTIWDLYGRMDARAAAWLEFAWNQMLDDFLPFKLALDQLPKRLEANGRQIEAAYHPVLNNDRLDRLVLVMTDVTAELERQRTRAEQQEFSALLDHFIKDRQAFRDFWREASKLVDRIVDAPQDDPALRRNVHTLKGNARYFGLSSLSALCHELEDNMQSRGKFELTDAERKRVADAWSSLSSRVDALIQDSTVFAEVSREDYERLLAAVRQRAPFEKIENLVKRLRMESVEGRFERAKKVLETACDKLGKASPRVVNRHDDLRLPVETWAPFWGVFAHVLTNTADHGIESENDRVASGKPARATVWLSAFIAGDELTIEVRDDGRGIDWQRVAERASAKGLPNGTRRELVEALLSEGISTKAEVSDMSGRGVGLAAVRSVVSAMRGRIEVDSEMGTGTTFRFSFATRLFETDQSSPARSIERAS